MKNFIKSSILITGVLAWLWFLNVAAEFTSVDSGTTAQTVNVGRSYVDYISVLNNDEDTINVLLYDLPTTTIATYTSTPRLNFQCFPHSQIFLQIPKSPSPMFTSAMQVRTVIRGTTTNTVNPAWYSIQSSTVAPTNPPTIKINHYNY